MSSPFVPSVGGILSADIAVPEHERELRFYSRVLTTGESPLWREDLMNNRGMPIIGLGPRGAEYADLPLQWLPHIQVADVATSVERALDLSGRELLHARDDGGRSQWAVLLDPNGAAFGLVPVVSTDELPSTEDEASLDGAAHMGRISWLDLTVSDASATRDFYRQVIGWSVRDIRMEEEDERYADYDMLDGGGNPAARIRHARGVNRSLPPVWLIHLPVGDLAESLRRVRAEGGRIIEENTLVDGEDAYAVIEDPVGTTLALVPG